MMSSTFTLLLLYTTTARAFILPLPVPHIPPVSSTEHAAGFGASSTSKKKTKKKPKSKSSILDEIQVDDAPTQAPLTPKLDRFGLPIPTEDDIFPPLTSDVVRVPVQENDGFSKEKIAEAIKNHQGINLSVFDDNGHSIHEERSNSGTSSRWTLKMLHQDPPVFCVDNFFSDSDVDTYVSMIESNEGSSSAENKDAVQMSSPTFSSSLSLSRRTSTTWFCKYKSVATLLAKAQRLLNLDDLKQIEEPQLVRYLTGQEFSWHYDEIPPNQLSNGGQRLATLLVYLNDVDAGGGTIFRDLKSPISKSSKRNDDHNQLTVRPKRGRALVFFPAYKKDGTPDQRTLHKGEVAQDKKMIAQLWIHEREYHAVLPEGNFQSEAVDGVNKELARLGLH